MQTARPIIVLVDNSAAMRDFFAQVATEARVTLHAYESAEESLTFLDRQKPDLLFLNIIMPNKDGFTFLQELRRHELHADTATVMISSKDYAQDRITAKELGVLEFAAKPITKKALRELIERYAAT